MGADVAENNRTVKEARRRRKESRANYYIKRYVYEAQQRVNCMKFPDQEPLDGSAAMPYA
jgi:hypothetical protein